MAGSAELQIRRFLLVLASVMCLGLGTELILLEHYQDWIQYVPLVLCGLGFLLSAWASIKKPTGVAVLLSVIAVAMIVASAVGVYQHFEHNFAFEREIRPNAETMLVVWESVKGASPVLSSGVLAAIGILILLGCGGRKKW